MKIDEHISPFVFLNHFINELNVKNKVICLDDSLVKSRAFDLDFDVIDVINKSDKYFGLISITVLVEVKMQNKLSFKCKLVLVGNFSAGVETMSEIEFVKMLKQNGTSALYSIARSIIIDVSAQSMVDGNIRLPLINVISYCQEKQRQKSSAVDN